ncbi:hypothetical protein CGMCC3_g17 [Colletotrichum fructicola]|nr:uncharacterized protein CGMCC3_g17 [Colletotrichum fructicola]KAE9583734.1 hypothetical protein CGMCC3_g17 [Colletotrichum fructicola]
MPEPKHAFSRFEQCSGITANAKIHRTPKLVRKKFSLLSLHRLDAIQRFAIPHPLVAENRESLFRQALHIKRIFSHDFAKHLGTVLQT